MRRGLAEWCEGRPRLVTVGRARSGWFGVHEPTEVEYEARPVDDVIEDALGSEATLVVVTGEAAAGASRSVARAARRMLGQDRCVAPRDPGDADVGGLVAAARRHGAALVWLDGAPLGVLDQVTPRLVDEARRAGVRLVVTTRLELLDADHPHPGTADLLRGAHVASLGPLGADDAREPHRHGRVVGYAHPDGAAAAAFVVPAGWSSLLPQAVVRVAAAWDVLGVPVALTPQRLASLVPATLEELDAPTVSGREIDAAVRRCAREPVRGLQVLRAGRRRGETHLRPHPLLRVARTSSAALHRTLREVLDTGDCHLVARQALAVGDDTTAATLLFDAVARGLGPTSAWRVADRLGYAVESMPWYRSTLSQESADPEVRRRAQVGLALVLSRHAPDAANAWTNRVEARSLMEAAVPDQQALLWLGEQDKWSAGGGPEAARAWWVRAAAGPEATLAGVAAARVAEVDIALGRDAAAVPYLEQVLAVGDEWQQVPTRLALGRVLRRLGRLDEAEHVLSLCEHDLLTPENLDDSPEDMRTERGIVAEERGDDDAARGFYEAAAEHDERALLRLCELELRTGDAESVRQRMDDAREPPYWSYDETFPRHDAATNLGFRDAGHRGWGAWLAGEAAFRCDDLVVAKRWFEGAGAAPGDRPARAALRLGQIALARGDVVDGYRRLRAASVGEGPVADEAAVLADEVERLAERRGRGVDHVRVVVLRDGSTRIEYGP